MGYACKLSGSIIDEILNCDYYIGQDYQGVIVWIGTKNDINNLIPNNNAPHTGGWGDRYYTFDNISFHVWANNDGTYWNGRIYAPFKCIMHVLGGNLHNSRATVGSYIPYQKFKFNTTSEYYLNWRYSGANSATIAIKRL